MYLHVESTHVTLDSLIGTDLSNPIQEIWMWAPAPGTAQFVASPASPSQPAHWASWVRSAPSSATLTRLQANAAYLIRSSSDFTWNLKGKPIVPYIQWTISGQNFIGFPTKSGVDTPTFDSFLTPAPELKLNAKIFRYQGGPITDNPVQVLDLTANKVERGQAYWISNDAFNRYFGPFDVLFTGANGVRFGPKSAQSSFRLRNNSDQRITITMSRIASESAPTGQPPVAGPVPILVRGSVNPATLTYTHAALATTPQTFTLEKSTAVGSEVEIVLGVDRSALGGGPGDVFASVIRFTDSLGLTQVDVGVAAEVGSNSGLWIGGATVNNVSHFLKPYAKASSASEVPDILTRLGLAEGVGGFHYEFEPSTKKILVFGGPESKTGSYLLDGPIKVDPGTVARPFPLRLIIHNDGTTSRLLQKVFVGQGLGTSPVVATKESLLATAQLNSARRISAVHLPTSTGNVPWNFTGTMAPGSSLTTTFDLAYDDQSSNPFLHTYHPDHDNLDAKFETQKPRGEESYTVRRQITLNFTPPAADFESLTRGGASLNGNYVEIVTFLGKSSGAAKQFDARGTFILNRITDLATLTQ